MINIQNIQTVLARMAELLRSAGRIDWALALEEFHEEIPNNPSTTPARILATFGGMGSINDLVLYKNGNSLINKNTEFDELRSTLYNLCHE